MRLRAVISSLLILGSQLAIGQEAKTGRIRFRVNNLQEESPVVNSDKMAPTIGIMSPTTMKGGKFQTNHSEVNLIGKVEDASRIDMVTIDSKIVEINKKGVFSTKVNLQKGENKFMVVAIDEHSNIKEKMVIIEYAPLEVSLAQKIAKESKYYALIIGIDNYPDPAIPSLDNPINDATKLRDILISKYTFDTDNIQFLTNSRRIDIIYALDNLARYVKSTDNLLIFYAGHGYYDTESNIGYWLPSDARKISKADWFRNGTLADYLKEIKSKHTLLITDACFGGSIFKSRSAFSDASTDIYKLYNLPSRKAMTSGSLTEVPDKSSFTAFLLDRLENNNQKYTSSEQLFSSFSTAVVNNSETEPQFGEIKNVGDQGGDFIFIQRQ